GAERLKENDEEQRAADREQRRVARLAAGLEKSVGEPSADNRTHDDPHERERARDEPLLRAASCQQSSEGHHDPVQPGHLRSRLVTQWTAQSSRDSSTATTTPGTRTTSTRSSPCTPTTPSSRTTSPATSTSGVRRSAPRSAASSPSSPT